MYVFISILILIAAVLLILIVLIQNSKGGGLASGFSSSNQIMGVRKTTDFLEKATWTLAGTVIVLSIIITAFIPRAERTTQSEIKDQVNNAATTTTTLPDFGTAQQDNNASAASTQQSDGANQDANASAPTEEKHQ
jgi:preprotein translocase subunit SecG